MSALAEDEVQKLRHLSIVVALMFGALGCISNSIGQLPGTVPPGDIRSGFSGGYIQSGPDQRAGGVPLEVSIRVGIIDRLDIGVRGALWSVEAEPKVQLIRGAFDLSLAVAGGVGRDPDTDALFEDRRTADGMYTARGRVLAGQRLTDVLDLVVSAGTMIAFRGGKLGDPEHEWHERAVAISGAIGFALGAEDHIMPEVSLMRVVSGDSPAGNGLDAGATLLQVSLTCLVGPSAPEQS